MQTAKHKTNSRFSATFVTQSPNPTQPNAPPHVALPVTVSVAHSLALLGE